MIDSLRRFLTWVQTKLRVNEGEHFHLSLQRGLNSAPSAPLATILKRVHGNIEQRRNAAFDLGYFSSREVLAVLLQLLNDPDEYVRVYAIQSLARLNDPAAVADLVHHAANAQPRLVLTNIIRTLADLRDQRATPVLCELLSSCEPMIRYDAAFALGEIQDPSALEVLERWTGDASMPSSGDDVETTGSVGQMVQKSIQKIRRGRAPNG